MTEKGSFGVQNNRGVRNEKGLPSRENNVNERDIL